MNSAKKTVAILLLAACAIAVSTTFAGLNQSQIPNSLAPHMPVVAIEGNADKLISMDFENVDIRIFIKTIGELTGINFLIDDNVTGTVTLVSPTKIRLAEVYEVFESVLRVKGFAAVDTGRIVKVVPRADAVRSNVSMQIGADPANISDSDRIITQIIPLQYANLTEINALVTPLLSSGGQMTTYAKTNSLIVTDNSSNIHRIAKLIAQLDTIGSKETTTVIPLKHGSAHNICQQIMQILQKSGANGSLSRPTKISAAINTNLKIIPDDRTNSLIVTANPKDTSAIMSLVAKLDVERSLETSNVHVIKLKHAEAKVIEKPLSASIAKIVPAGQSTYREPLQITADESTNSLIIVASSQYYKVIEDMIEQLDVVREMVLVEFQIIEASDDTLKEIGVDWATLDEAVADGIRGFALSNLGPRVEMLNGNLQGLAMGVHKKVGDTVTIGAVLKALEKNSGVNILSTPHILTSNHQEATILIADNVPYVKDSRFSDFGTTDSASQLRSFDFKDVGIELAVTPHITPGELVRLQIDAGFSKLVPSAATGVVGGDTPTTAKREIDTVISIPSGTTVVIGGLIRDDVQIVEKKIPLLGDLPIVGGLFKTESTQNQKTNLLLFITPHVLTNKDDIEKMTEIKKQQTSQSEVSIEKQLKDMIKMLKP